MFPTLMPGLNPSSEADLSKSKRRLTQATLLQGVEELSRKDRGLARLSRRHGPPPMWGRKADFAALLKIILEQQVSLTSAAAVYQRLSVELPSITASEVVNFTESGLRELGFTRQKASYCYGLAEMICNSELDLKAIGRMDDDKAHDALLKVRGIGTWTANIYLLMALRRPDIWPHGDLALAESARRMRKLEIRPDYDRLDKMALRWRPWRSVAARILWHAYLCENDKPA